MLGRRCCVGPFMAFCAGSSSVLGSAQAQRGPRAARWRLLRQALRKGWRLAGKKSQ